MEQLSLHIGDKLHILERPLVMGIINVTPDSFACHCTNITEAEILKSAAKAIQEGADILDLGGCSTRPGAEMVSEEEEWRRIHLAASAIRREWPEAVLSVDTFRASIARKAVDVCNVDIINDISGGTMDADMFATVADLQTPYILTHMRGTPATMQEHTHYNHLISDVLAFLQERTDELHQLGVKDVIIDPGFGFAKTTEQNYELLRKLHYLRALGLPILVGLSRKSMIYKALNCTPQEALNGTTALHMLALEQGASILRVHDVKEAKEAITLYTYYHGS